MKLEVIVEGNAGLARVQVNPDSCNIFAGSSTVKMKVHEPLGDLAEWLKRNVYRGYDTFGGLSFLLFQPLTRIARFWERCYSKEFAGVLSTCGQWRDRL